MMSRRYARCGEYVCDLVLKKSSAKREQKGADVLFSSVLALVSIHSFIHSF